jgi:uncharacterized OB-fold protein
VWVPLPPDGCLFTWTVVGRTTLPEYATLTPYAVGIIEVAHLGIRVVGFLDHPPNELSMGMRLAWRMFASPGGDPRMRWVPLGQVGPLDDC